jgi:hypothetical protein
MHAQQVFARRGYRLDSRGSQIGVLESIANSGEAFWAFGVASGTGMAIAEF